MGRPKLTERANKIVKMFQETRSTRVVADTFGISPNTVRYVLKQNNIPTPREGRVQNHDTACERNRELVLRLCEEGHSLAEIARRVGTVGREVKKFLRRNGVTKEFVTWREGEDHYAWKGRLIDKDGYILVHVKGHPNARKHTHYILEHRLVMEEALGRTLLPNEVVHHRDGNKQNNALENLQLFDSNGEHLAVDLKDRCPNWTPEGRERIRKGTIRRWRLWKESNQNS